MNLSGSSNKHPLNPKDYQIQVIQGESKGSKPRVQRKHKIVSEYLREDHENLQLPSDPAPSAFSFKEERILAAHPPSCHPRRVFGCPESERK